MRYLRVFVFVVVLAALASGAASAANPPPSSDSGLVNQYREDVPTAGGPSTPGSGGGNYTTPLPGNIRSDLYNRAGKDAKTLEKIATSSRYGAPRSPTHGLDAGSPGAASPNALSAAVSAVSDGSDGRLIGLFIALLVVAAMMLGTAAAKRGRRTA